MTKKQGSWGELVARGDLPPDEKEQKETKARIDKNYREFKKYGKAKIKTTPREKWAIHLYANGPKKRKPKPWQKLIDQGVTPPTKDQQKEANNKYSNYYRLKQTQEIENPLSVFEEWARSLYYANRKKLKKEENSQKSSKQKNVKVKKRKINHESADNSKEIKLLNSKNIHDNFNDGDSTNSIKEFLQIIDEDGLNISYSPNEFNDDECISNLEILTNNSDAPLLEEKLSEDILKDFKSLPISNNPHVPQNKKHSRNEQSDNYCNTLNTPTAKRKKHKIKL